jgi:hypothetical protein
VGLVQRIPAITQPRHDAGPIVFDEHIGLGEQRFEQGAVGIRLEIESQRLLAAIDAGEIGGFFAHERPDAAAVIAAVRVFDLDDAGTEIGQHHGAIGTGQHAREIEDEEAGERAGIVGRGFHGLMGLAQLVRGRKRGVLGWGALGAVQGLRRLGPWAPDPICGTALVGKSWHLVIARCSSAFSRKSGPTGIDPIADVTFQESIVFESA